MTEHPKYGYWVKHPVHNPKGTHNTIPLTEADKRNGWTEVVLVAQQPTTHVQNPAEIEHVAGDVSKNGPESNMMDLIDAYAEARHVGGCHTYNAKTAEARAKVVAALRTQQPAPAGATSSNCAHEWDGMVRTSMPPRYACKHCHHFFDSPPTPQPAPATQQAASSAVLKAIREANMQLVRTGDDAFMLMPYKVATAQATDRTVSHKAQAIPGVQWQCGPQASGFTAQAAESVLEDAARRTTEQEHAIRQGHEIAASDGYFEARPQIDCIDRRRVFTAGFGRGWDAARKQGGA